MISVLLFSNCSEALCLCFCLQNDVKFSQEMMDGDEKFTISYNDTQNYHNYNIILWQGKMNVIPSLETIKSTDFTRRLECDYHCSLGMLFWTNLYNSWKCILGNDTIHQQSKNRDIHQPATTLKSLILCRIASVSLHPVSEWHHTFSDYHPSAILNVITSK